MGYTISLVDENNEVMLLKHSLYFGGSQHLTNGGETEMLMTYNYLTILQEHFHESLNDKWSNGIRWLCGKQARATVDKLLDAILKLGIARSEDYFKPTYGNVGFSLWVLLGWALEYPNAKWRVTN